MRVRFDLTMAFNQDSYITASPSFEVCFATVVNADVREGLDVQMTVHLLRTRAYREKAWERDKFKARESMSGVSE